MYKIHITYTVGPHIFQKCKVDLRILVIKWVTRSEEAERTLVMFVPCIVIYSSLQYEQMKSHTIMHLTAN